MLCRSANSATLNFYPRPPRGGRPAPGGHREARKSISIHALREEGDLAGQVVLLDQVGFLSTPSARRATYRMTDKTGPLAISIHALREEGDRDAGQLQRPGTISIHALREEGDSPT